MREYKKFQAWVRFWLTLLGKGKCEHACTLMQFWEWIHPGNLFPKMELLSFLRWNCNLLWANWSLMPREMISVLQFRSNLVKPVLNPNILINSNQTLPSLGSNWSISSVGMLWGVRFYEAISSFSSLIKTRSFKFIHIKLLSWMPPGMHFILLTECTLF